MPLLLVHRPHLEYKALERIRVKKKYLVLQGKTDNTTETHSTHCKDQLLKQGGTREEGRGDKPI